jgi:hypothetical protein
MVESPDTSCLRPWREEQNPATNCRAAQRTTGSRLNHNGGNHVRSACPVAWVSAPREHSHIVSQPYNENEIRISLNNQLRCPQFLDVLHTLLCIQTILFKLNVLACINFGYCWTTKQIIVFNWLFIFKQNAMWSSMYETKMLHILYVT